MIAGSIARRYAKALLNAAKDRGTLEETGQELEQMVGVLDSSDDLQSVLSNPMFAKDKRKAVLGEVASRLGLSTLIQRFLAVVVERNRLRFLPNMAQAFKVLADDALGRTRAEVVSAIPLSSEQLARVTQSLATATGKKVVIEQSVDPSLVGGPLCRTRRLSCASSSPRAASRSPLLPGRPSRRCLCRIRRSPHTRLSS